MILITYSGISEKENDKTKKIENFTEWDFNRSLLVPASSKNCKDIKKQKGIIQLYLICMHNILHGMFVEISS